MTRRSALLLGLGASCSAAGLQGWAFAAGEFWNDKDPPAWSKKEMHRLLSRSPWAKVAALVFRGAPGGVLDDIARPRGTGGRGSGSGLPGAGSEGSGMGGAEMGGTPQINVLVRWESAAPVREAAHQLVPAEALEYYIISVSGLPAVGHGLETATEGPGSAEPRQRMEEQFKETAELIRKGKEPIHPERLHTIEQAGRRAVLLFFPRAPRPITPEDKDVTLAGNIGPAQLRIDFSLKDMLYRGNLEL